MLALNRLPSFVDYTHAFVDETVLDAPISSLEHVAGWLAQVPFDIAARGVGRLAGLTHERDTALATQRGIVDTVFTTPWLRDGITKALVAGRGSVVVAPQTVTRLARLTVLQASHESATFRPLHELLMQRALIGTASLDGRQQPQPSMREILATLVQIGAINARVPLLETLARWHYLYTDLAESAWAAANPHYCDVAQWSKEAFGLTPMDQAATAIGAAINSKVFDAPEVGADFGALASDWASVMAAQLQLDPTALADLISAPREWFAERLEDWRARHGLSEGEAASSMYSAAFDARPFVRTADGQMVLWSPRSFLYWATDGFRDRAHAAAQLRGRGQRFSRFHAALVEKYCLDLVAEAYPDPRPFGSGRVSGEQLYTSPHGERRSSDIAVDCGLDLVLIEVASSQFAPDAKALGTATHIESDLLRLLIKKATQLSARIDDLLAGLFSVPGVVTAEIQRIWPVVVTGSGLFMTEPLWGAINERIGAAFSQPQSQPLVVMDAYDLETLVGLCEAGASMHQVLARKAHGAYRALDFSRFIYDDPHLQPKRAASIIRRSDQMFDDFATRVGMDAAELGKMRDAARERGELL